tara:strand:+ start:107 stop:586 length:480 start_codon:yes stop_codon:yes gene_type:complete
MKKLKDLIELKHKIECQKYPSMPPDYIPLTKFTDKTANGLTKCVIAWINLNGGQAERINTMGRMLDKTKVVADTFGNKRTIGSVEWQKGTGQKGSADISATIQGRSVKIEVKMKDKQSIDQIKYQNDIENAGGQYWLVHNFDEFMFHYECFIDYLTNLK